MASGLKGGVNFPYDLIESFDYGSFINATEEPISEGIFLGKTKGSEIVIGSTIISIEADLEAYKLPLKEIYPEKTDSEKGLLESFEMLNKKVRFRNSMAAKPKVYIPVFPGTNCEYDTGKAFRKAGGETIILPFLNGSETIIEKKPLRLWLKALIMLKY
nr:phosphoribosylformylglycinamidine synthase subunit PurQ [endosymbiont 'TC1' of Trimyema compressum]